MAGVEGKKFKILHEKSSVITRAAFWKIRHDTPRDDVCLKVGRYKKHKDSISLIDEETLVRIPYQSGHAFHGKVDTDSRANWTVIPRQSGQLI